MTAQPTQRAKAPSEAYIQRLVEAAIGSLPDVLLMRNSVGVAEHHSESTGRKYHVPYGLGVGSPDLVAMLTVQTAKGPRALWFALELKRPGESPTARQVEVMANWRAFGAYVEVAHSVEEALAALERARKWAREAVAA